MKIIDAERKGNVVRIYLGEDDLEYWWGDDWDDAPYEHNAGRVYEQYISGHTDWLFDFDDIVLEPCCGTSNSWVSKEDMIKRKVPCIIVVPKHTQADHWWVEDDFAKWVGADGVKKYYFGDKMED